MAPTNLAFIDGCSTGPTNTFAEGLLYPFGNYYAGTGSFPEDQAEVGYVQDFQTEQTKACATAFYQAMADGWDVDYARQQAWAAYDGSNKVDSYRDFMRVWGDQTMRLKGVYTGNKGKETRWHD